MVQAYHRGPNGSIQFCYIHDLLHDLAIRKADEDNFLTVSSKPDDQKSCSGARRLAFHHGKYDKVMKEANPNLRSLLCFKEIPNIYGHRQLKVLSRMEKDSGLLPKKRYTGDFPTGHILNLPKDKCDLTKNNEHELLISLRYLQLNTVNELKGFVGPKMIFLQTLDLRCAEPVDLPESIWNIKTLRHVLLPDNYGQWTLGPPPLVDMKNLQTLCNVTARVSWTSEGLPKFPCLRELHMEVDRGYPWEVIAANFIDTLKRLEILSLRGLGREQEKKIRNTWKHLYFTGDPMYNIN